VGLESDGGEFGVEGESPAWTLRMASIAMIRSEGIVFIFLLGKKVPAYWLVMAGRFVPTLLVIANALVISAAGRLLSMSLVDGLFVFVESFPQPTRNMIAKRGMNIFTSGFVVEGFQCLI
jgi:hypothetical protein